MWDALVVFAIPELGAEPADTILVRPEHPEYPVLVVKRHGAGALALIHEHRRRLWSRDEDAGNVDHLLVIFG